MFFLVTASMGACLSDYSILLSLFFHIIKAEIIHKDCRQLLESIDAGCGYADLERAHAAVTAAAAADEAAEPKI